MAVKTQRSDTVQRVLAAALAVYRDSGPAGFKLTAVTEASGVSVGSVYHHFGSFDGLAATLFSRCMGDLLNSLAAAVEEQRTARGGIVACVATYLEWTASHRAEALFIHASAGANFLPLYRDEIAADKAARVRRLTDWLRPHVQAGEVADLPPAMIEALVIGPAAEVARRWLTGAGEFDIDTASRLLPERVWQSVRGRTEEETG